MGKEEGERDEEKERECVCVLSKWRAEKESGNPSPCKVAVHIICGTLPND